MKRTVLGAAFLALMLMSACSENQKPVEVVTEQEEIEVDGYAVYQKNCQSCHVEMMTAKEAMANIKTLVAPPMVEVSQQVKKMITYNGGDEDTKRELVLTFIRDYIQYPNIDKAMCNLGAIDQFDVMPSLKGVLSEAELFAVAQWVYDRYEDTSFE